MVTALANISKVGGGHTVPAGKRSAKRNMLWAWKCGSENVSVSKFMICIQLEKDYTVLELTYPAAQEAEQVETSCSEQ